MTKVFIDGSAGTTGLRIKDRLSQRADIELISLAPELRKDPEARREAMRAAQIAFLCLPDQAAIEAVELAGEDTVLIDTSTAHRTNPGWDYGFPELEGRREKIAASRRVANPGCHASGFIVLVEPLVRAGIIPKDLGLSCFSVTGYSGGGKAMIAQYEAPDRSHLLSAPRQYALGQSHKHLKEMRLISGLELDPVFCPIVADYYSGMEVTVPLMAKDLRGSIEDICQVYRARYSGGLVRFMEDDPEEGLLSASALSGRDSLEVRVRGNADRILLISRFDNLGKGASGAAIQNMNIILGLNEEEGLIS